MELIESGLAHRKVRARMEIPIYIHIYSHAYTAPICTLKYCYYCYTRTHFHPQIGSTNYNQKSSRSHTVFR